jgi:hypothetical protein
MDLASKTPTGGPNCDARHDASDILTDTSPASRLSALTNGLMSLALCQPVARSN